MITDSSGPLGLPGLFPVLFSVVPILNGGFGVVLPGTGHQEPGQLVGDCFAVKEGAGPGLFRDQIEDRNVSWRAALDWTPADDTLLYASLAKGFKSGGYPVLNATVHSQFTPTEQEELLSYEVGSKQKLFDKKLVLNTALFYYDYRNKQLLTRMLDPVFGALPILRNAPRSHVYGAELEIQANPLRGLFVGAAAAYIKTEIDEFVSTNIDGKPFNFAPEWTASVVADYTLPYLPFELFSISLGADLSYSGATNSTLENDPRFAHEPYTTVGARLRLSSASDVWNLTFFGRNLSNELQTISSINVGDSIGRFVGQPRTYGATLELKFR